VDIVVAAWHHYNAAMPSLLDDLNAFLQRHRRRGAMKSGVEDGRAWMTCAGCGGSLTLVLRG